MTTIESLKQQRTYLKNVTLPEDCESCKLAFDQAVIAFDQAIKTFELLNFSDAKNSEQDDVENHDSKTEVDTDE